VQEIERLLWKEWEGPHIRAVRNWIRRLGGGVLNGIGFEPTRSRAECRVVANLIGILSQVGLEIRADGHERQQDWNAMLRWAEASLKLHTLLDDPLDIGAAHLRLGLAYDLDRNKKAAEQFDCAVDVLKRANGRAKNNVEPLELLVLAQFRRLRTCPSRQLVNEVRQLGRELPGIRLEYFREMAGVSVRDGKRDEALSWLAVLVAEQSAESPYDRLRNEKVRILERFAAGARDEAIARIEENFLQGLGANLHGFYRQDILEWSKRYGFDVPPLPQAQYKAPFSHYLAPFSAA
jgi:hypothetical protein